MTKTATPAQQLNLSIVALVALVAIVGLVALVLNAPATSESGFSVVQPTIEQAAPIVDENLVGEKKMRPPRTGPVIR